MTTGRRVKRGTGGTRGMDLVCVGVWVFVVVSVGVVREEDLLVLVEREVERGWEGVYVCVVPQQRWVRRREEEVE
jgi:hypothetical protein